jgi:hypothetical protein
LSIIRVVTLGYILLVVPGHIGIAVPDVDKACERFKKLNVEFVKKPNDGKLCFLIQNRVARCPCIIK